MIAQSTLISYHTEAFVKTEVACTVGNETSVRVWEHYEINLSVPRKILYMGSWNLDAGFQQMDAQKWIRRRDLEVRSFKSFLHYRTINVVLPNPIRLQNFGRMGT